MWEGPQSNPILIWEGDFYLCQVTLRAYYRKGCTEAGCDEAGRGCLAGPVVAAAVILDPGWNHRWLHDSKQLTARQREVVASAIRSEAIAWAVAESSPEEIDRLNILQASLLAMHRAIEGLGTSAELLLIDGNRFRPYLGLPHVCVVGGDAKFRSIAAASILAKTARDAKMVAWHARYPEYGWLDNKGYPTIFHRQALAQYGPTPLHRTSFHWRPIEIETSEGQSRHHTPM